jgi:hypothetical protein
MSGQEEIGGIVCSICTDIVQENYKTVCNHEFCLPCILAWSNTLQLNRSDTSCPTCRRPISRQDILMEHNQRLRNAPNNQLVSIEAFIRLKGVQFSSLTKLYYRLSFY